MPEPEACQNSQKRVFHRGDTCFAGSYALPKTGLGQLPREMKFWAREVSMATATALEAADITAIAALKDGMEKLSAPDISYALSK